MPDAPLYLLPGLGADSRLYDLQRAHFGNRLVTPEFIPAGPGEMLSQYVQRWLERMRPPREFYLGGLSFGGMAAIEMAKLARPRAVFLIASCRSRRCIARRFRVVRWGGAIVPSVLAGPFLGAGAWTFAWLNGLTSQQRAVLTSIARDADINLLKSLGEMCVTWPHDGTLDVPVAQIHGDTDRVIPLRDPAADLTVLPGAHHLIQWTHADAVNAWLQAKMAQHA
jgi:pimeloyl-ACP methyl ester carboxylesterase